MNYCNFFGLVTGELERQRPVLKKPEFLVTLETSKTLGAESGPLYVFNSISSGSPTGESSEGGGFPFVIAILSVV